MKDQSSGTPIRFAVARAALAGCEVVSSRSQSLTGRAGEPWSWRTSARRGSKMFRHPNEAAMDYFEMCRVEEMPDTYVTTRFNDTSRMFELHLVSWDGSKASQFICWAKHPAALTDRIKAAVGHFKVPHFSEIELRVLEAQPA